MTGFGSAFMLRGSYRRRKASTVRAVRRLVLAIGIASAFLVLAAVPQEATATRTVTYPFIAGSYVIPMDDQQPDLLHAFGLVHAILRKGVPAYRVLTPPAVLLKVDALGPKVPFDGGPILVWGTYSTEFSEASAAFPGVAYFRLAELEVLDHVLPIRKPTGVLVMKGGFDWGHTEILLNQLGIPYEVRQTSDVVADPSLLFNYALVVDDCNGWSGAYPGDAVADAFRAFVAGGGHASFTDIALKDMEVLFPGHVSLFVNARGTYNATIHTFGDAPSQYFGPDAIPVFTEIDGVVMGPPIADGVNVLLDLPNYPAGFQRTAYRILAAYFGYGNGTVEGFAYHPFEQTGAGHTFSSVLYGNTFVSAVPFLPPAPPPVPAALGLPTPPPAPPVPPPPPPPPSLPVVNLAYTGYLFAGFAGLGVTDALRNRLRLRAREKIAVRV